MGIRFRCKNCCQKYELADEWAGKVSECLRCGIAMQVPEIESQKCDTLESFAPPDDITRQDNIRQIQIVSATTRTGTADDIIFRCKLCSQKYRLPKALAGQVATCAKCKKNMIVPSGSEAFAGETLKPENSVVFWCKTCGAKYRLNKKLTGQQVECTRCKSSFSVPDVSETAPPPKNSDQKNKIPADIIKGGMVTAEAATNVKTIKAVKTVYKISELDRIPVRTRPNQLVENSASAAPAAPPPETSAQVSMQPVDENGNNSDSGKLHRLEPDSEKTHSTIIATKTVTMMVKYIIKLPRENLLTAWASVAFDCFTQLPVLRRIPKQAFIYIIILLALTGSLYLARNLLPKKDRPPQFQIHTMCPKCSKREIMNLLDIEEGVCSNEPCAKCQTKVGYAWKCWKCLRYFPKTNTDRLIIQDPKLSRQEKMLLLKPPKCPYCRSPKVNYVSAEDATFG